MQPQVSIIVPVYNGEKYIKKCLESLLQQTYPSEKHEIIVVDNGSSDNSIQVAENYDVKTVKEAKRGSYAARNAGIKVARGKIIGFIDVDCIASNKWIEYGVECFIENPNIDILSGKIEFFSDAQLTIWGYFDKNTFLNQETSYVKGIAKTANLFISSKAFKKVGLFNDLLQSGGDVDWTSKAVVNGVSIHYEPNAIVYHPVRNGFKEVAQKVYRVGVGKGQVLKQNYAWRNTNFGNRHLKHPFVLMGLISKNNDKGQPKFYLIKIIFAVWVLSFIFLSGMIKGFFISLSLFPEKLK